MSNTFKNEEDHPPFYGKNIITRDEKAYILQLLKKYRHEKVTDELKAKIWDELQMEKSKGNIMTPFKLAIRRDSSKQYPDFIEIILDTKV